MYPLEKGFPVCGYYYKTTNNPGITIKEYSRIVIGVHTIPVVLNPHYIDNGNRRDN